MVMAALGDRNGGCETAAPTCSARQLKVNEFPDLIKYGLEKSTATTEKVETPSSTWGRIQTSQARISAKHIIISV